MSKNSIYDKDFIKQNFLSVKGNPKQMRAKFEYLEDAESFLVFINKDTKIKF